MASLQLQALKKSFGSTEIIRGIDLEIAEGEFIALVGPSGCGKSTLLRMIAGLEGVSDGDILIDGQSVSHQSPRERNIAMVFQSYALYPHMNVRQNIEFNLKLSGVSTGERRHRVEQAAALMEISELLERRPGQLSGGQRQRVAMGRAVVRDPALFLFDEPLSNLDAKLRVQMRTEIKALHQKVRKTSIYVTHDQIEAMTLADRIVVLNKGRIEQIGRPLELYRKPANLFVAAFIGSPSMNFFRGVIEESATGMSARFADGQTLAIESRHRSQVGKTVIIGIRPEHLTVCRGEQALNAHVRLVEPTGAQTHVQFTLAGQTATAVVDGLEEIAPGEVLPLSISPARVHLFDASTEAALD